MKCEKGTSSLSIFFDTYITGYFEISVIEIARVDYIHLFVPSGLVCLYKLTVFIHHFRCVSSIYFCISVQTLNKVELEKSPRAAASYLHCLTLPF